MFSKVPKADPGMVDRIKDELAIELHRVTEEAQNAEATVADRNKERLRLKAALTALKSI